MKNVVLGIVIGVCVALLCVGGMLYFGRRDDTAPPSPPGRKGGPAELYEAGPSPSPDPELGLVDEAGEPIDPADLLAAELEAARERALAGEEPEGIPETPEVETDTATAIEKLAQYHEARSRNTRREMLDKIEEIKKKGREAVPDLMTILRGEGSAPSKIIAAGVLGAINAELQDPGIQSTLTKEALPMLREVINSDADRNVRRQAISALGEIKNDAAAAALGDIIEAGDRGNMWTAINALGSVGTETAHGILADIVTSDRERWVKMFASRTLGRQGTLDAAYQVLPALRNPGDDSELLLAATTVAQINARVNDPDIADQLKNAVPHLKGMLTDEAKNRSDTWLALSALSSIGGPDANQVLLDLARNENEADKRLQQTAIWAMSQYGKPEVTTELGEALRTVENSDRRIDIAMAIVSIANNNPTSLARGVSDSQAMPVLRRLASTGESVDIQRRALRAIGRVGSPGDVEALEQIGAANQKLQSSVDEAVREIKRRADRGSGYRSRWFRAW